ncbi:integrin beta-2 [Alosa pseudoharengus]|uniref:integrin beta-2 n=1 Tax=Alosa pseudoharengus TaxID=34774 RepID=UPI003F8C988F
MAAPVRLQVLILLSITTNVWLEQTCEKGAVHSCNDCIKSGAFCSWCKSVNFTNQGESDAERCETKAKLMEKGCKETDIISPQNSKKNIKQKPLSGPTSTTDAVQIEPQEIKLELRPGLPEKITLKFKRAEGYPVDLYYLMDLSYSMVDDLKLLKTLGKDLVAVLQKITGGNDKARIGFGSFVDKTVLPFTNTNKEKLKNPCPTNEKETVACQPPFGFKHVLDLTNNYKSFNEEVSKQDISGNLDTPEGSLDAIMQAAMCERDIGWGNATRLLVLATDAGFHMAGDGKLAAILEPNDELCHLTQNMYSKSNLLDYPSVGQIARTLQKKNIQPIFAVTSSVKGVYDDLSKLIPKSVVGELTDDSSNVVQLIENAYDKLSSKVIVTHDVLPDKVTVTYTSNCPEGNNPGDEGICDNVKLGQEVQFFVEVTAHECMNNISFYVGPRGFTEKMKVTISTRCECECDDPPFPNDPLCNSQGEVKCGTCKCNKGYTGQKCKCKQGDRNDADLRQLCRGDNSTECGGRGDCVCGECQCHKSQNGNPYYKKYCECVDEGCQMHNNKECSGHGDCRCGTCKCHSGYDGDACHCKVSDAGCRTGGSICNGRGECQCDICKCKGGYQPPFCLECQACTPPCQQSANCIECLGFGGGPYDKNCTTACKHLKHVMVERLSFNTQAKKCEVKDSLNCWLDFTMKEMEGMNNYFVEILKERRCPEPPPIPAIVAGSVAGVALIGLLILLIIKALLYAKDLKEWKKFENEKKKSKWSNADNPLFKEATTTVTNPTFSGE